MKKILLSLGLIAIVAAVSISATGAFFSDTETSTANVFTAGAIDLKIDNESYVTSTTTGEFIRSPWTSWESKDLDGELFFDFEDVKPGDMGEDTISLVVDNNDAYACMNITITGTPENGQTEPEAKVDQTAGENEGELQNALNFVFWADDGDNVFEVGENVIAEGSAAEIFTGNHWTLADTQKNIWNTEEVGGPIKGTETYYVAKMWCLGDLEKDPLPQQEGGDPLTRGTGFNCSGAGLGNETQTDGVVADVEFYAVQSRNNNQFLCSSLDRPEEPEITVTTGDGWSPEALTGVLNQNRWLAKARYGGVNTYELEVGFGPGLRDEDNHNTWADNVGETFTLNYNNTTKVATLTVGSDVSSYTVVGTPSSIGITAKGSASNGITKFENVTLDGNPVPDLVSTISGHKYVSISGPAVSDDFVLTGTVTLDWITPANENPTLQVDVMY